MSRGPLVVIVTSKGSPCRCYPGNIFLSPQVQLRLIPKLLLDRFRLWIGTRIQVRYNPGESCTSVEREFYTLRNESTTINLSNTYDHIILLNVYGALSNQIFILKLGPKIFIKFLVILEWDVEVNPLNEIELWKNAFKYKYSSWSKSRLLEFLSRHTACPEWKRESAANK